MNAFCHILLSLALLGVVRAVEAADLPADQVEFFETRIRPVLAQDCYECHSTGGKAKGGLVLDTRESLLQGGDTGSGLIPGKAEESLLIQAIRQEHEDLAMPKSGAKLDDSVIADFVKWVNMGAPDPRDEPPTAQELAKDTDWESIRDRRMNWWSFQPIQDPAVPNTGDAHPVDAFVREQLETVGLEASSMADPEVLVRRLYFALTGLPPNPDETDAFLAAWKTDPKAAFSQTTSDLLESPQFGERWARHWMDWIRYAESHGSEGDPAIPNAVAYRDYLIRALNADVSYDQLVREHVAGDLLESPRINEALGINESMIGPAHWRMVFHGFAPTDALDEKVRFTDDQINVFSKAFLGLTVSCARCHHHKFDPISQDDFYAFFGILGSTRPAMQSFDLPNKLDRNREELKSLKQQIHQGLASAWLDQVESTNWKAAATRKEPGELVKLWAAAEKSGDVAGQWKRFRDTWEKQRAAWEEHLRTKYPRRWDLTDPDAAKSWYPYGEGLEDGLSAAGEFTLNPEGNSIVRDVFPASYLTHALSDKHRGVLTSENFQLEGEYDLYLRVAGGGKAMARYVVQNYPRRGTVYPVTEMNDGEWKWLKYDLTYWDGDQIHIELVTSRDAPLLSSGSDRSWFAIREAVLQKKGEAKPPSQTGGMWEPLFDLGDDRAPETLGELKARYEKALRVTLEAWSQGKASDAQAQFLDAALHAGLLANELKALPSLAGLVTRYRTLEAEVPVPRRVPGLQEAKGIDQALFVRGNHKKPGDPVPRRFLEAIDETPYQSDISGRRELAEDLLRHDNPLTSRVIVNRIWHHLFGDGLVATVDNFGRLGQEPSHPELLDHLAVRFVEEGWSIKELIRYLVTSETWQQSSKPSELALAQDPENKWLSHANVRRLEAEAIRDSLLAISGELDPSMFGGTINGDGDRRSVYVKVIRNSLDPFLQAFDAPIPFSTVGNRSATNVPAQSLTLLNDPFVMDLANRWAKHILKDESLTTPEAKLRHMFRYALGRAPEAQELAFAQEFKGELQEQYAGVRTAQESLRQELAKLQKVRESILAPVRERLIAEQSDPARQPIPPQPYAHWTFENGFDDIVGNLDGQPFGNARIEDGALCLDGESYVATVPLQKRIGEKTLEALVQLETLDQRGGGVVSMQTLNGGVFDAIVFAERRTNRWLSGSNRFERTSDFEGYDETEAVDRPVHIVIAYDEDGTIRGYRNGQAYGRPYRQADPVSFEPGSGQLLFGLRHGSPSGNRVLRGKILDAKFYDRALNDGEVAAAAGVRSIPVTEANVRDALESDASVRVSKLDSQIESLRSQIGALGQPGGEEQVWADLAHALFNLKEFIFIQ